jgi:hypothetical protein
MTRLTFGDSLGSNSTPPVWSPDGRYLIFRKPGQGLFWTRSDGAGQPQLLVRSTTGVSLGSFTPDRKRLAFRQLGPGTGLDLWTVPVESDGAGLRGGKPELFLGTMLQIKNCIWPASRRRCELQIILLLLIKMVKNYRLQRRQQHCCSTAFHFPVFTIFKKSLQGVGFP